MNFKYKLGIIGYGNMSSAILQGCICKGFIANKDVFIFDMDKSKIKNGISANNIKEIYNACEYILLAVKPQNANDILRDMPYNDNVIISIMAGISIKHIKEMLSQRAKVIRCMPNTPCLIGEGMTALSFSAVEKNDIDFVKNIFLSNGEIIEVEEKDLHAVTSVSGSGPAYFYMFIKSIIDSGVSSGLEYDIAKKLALQTAVGASKMIELSTENIDVLIDRVCSKGGTTIEAVNYFKENNFDAIVKGALEKCYKRSKELS